MRTTRGTDLSPQRVAPTIMGSGSVACKSCPAPLVSSPCLCSSPCMSSVCSCSTRPPSSPSWSPSHSRCCSFLSSSQYSASSCSLWSLPLPSSLCSSSPCSFSSAPASLRLAKQSLHPPSPLPIHVPKHPPAHSTDTASSSSLSSLALSSHRLGHTKRASPHHLPSRFICSHPSHTRSLSLSPSLFLLFVLSLFAFSLSVCHATPATVYALWVPKQVDESLVDIKAVCDHNMAAVDDHSFVVFNGNNDDYTEGTNTHLYYLDVNKSPLQWQYYTPVDAFMPSERCGSGLAQRVNPTNQHEEMFVSGGNNGNILGKLSDFWRFDFQDKTWTQLPDLASGPRAWHTSVMINDTAILMLNGEDGYQCYNDTYVYDISSQQWSPFETKQNQNRPVRGEGSPCVFHQGRQLMFCYGGFKGEGGCFADHGMAGAGKQCYTSDLFVLNLRTRTWLPPIKAKTEDLPVSFSTLTLQDDYLWIFGGAYLDSGAVWAFFSSVRVFDIIEWAWAPVEISGTPPAPRWSLPAVLLSPQQNLSLSKVSYSSSNSASSSSSSSSFSSSTSSQSLTSLTTNSRQAPGREIWIFGGCSDLMFKDVHALLLHRRITADQCRVELSDISQSSPCIAGQRCNFTIAVYPSASASEPVDFLTALTFEFTVVQTLSSGRMTSVLGETVEDEERPGYYNAYFTATYGSSVTVVVFLQKQEISGSPFTMSLQAAQPTLDTTRLAGGANGYTGDTWRAIAGHKSEVKISQTDVYMNPVNGTALLSSSARFRVVVSSANCSVSLGSLLSRDYASSAQSSSSSSSLSSSSSSSPTRHAYTSPSIIGSTDIIRKSQQIAALPPCTTSDLVSDIPFSADPSSSSDGLLILSYTAPATPGSLFLHVLYDGQEIAGSPRLVLFIDQWSLPAAASAVTSLFATSGFIISTLVLAAFILTRRRPSIKANSVLMMSTCSVGGLVLNMSVFLLIFSHQGAGYLWLCFAEPIMFSVGFQLLLGSLIAKQWRLKKIFLSRTLRVSYVSELWLFLLVVALCAIDTAIVSCSLIVDTPVVGQAYVDGLLTAPHCDQDNSTRWLLVIWAFRGLVLAYGATIALYTHDLPNRYSDATVTGIATYNLVVFCAFDILVSAYVNNVSTALVLTTTMRVYDACSTLLLLSAPKLLFPSAKSEPASPTSILASNCPAAAVSPYPPHPRRSVQFSENRESNISCTGVGDHTNHNNYVDNSNNSNNRSEDDIYYGRNNGEEGQKQRHKVQQKAKHGGPESFVSQISAATEVSMGTLPNIPHSNGHDTDPNPTTSPNNVPNSNSINPPSPIPEHNTSNFSHNPNPNLLMSPNPHPYINKPSIGGKINIEVPRSRSGSGSENDLPPVTVSHARALSIGGQGARVQSVHSRRSSADFFLRMSASERQPLSSLKNLARYDKGTQTEETRLREGVQREKEKEKEKKGKEKEKKEEKKEKEKIEVTKEKEKREKEKEKEKTVERDREGGCVRSDREEVKAAKEQKEEEQEKAQEKHKETNES